MLARLLLDRGVYLGFRRACLEATGRCDAQPEMLVEPFCLLRGGCAGLITDRYDGSGQAMTAAPDLLCSAGGRTRESGADRRDGNGELDLCIPRPALPHS